MPKQIPATELDAVVQVVGQFPNGAAVSEVRGALDIELSRRTLQRRLARLVEAGRLETFGEGRAQRYRVSPLLEEGTPPVTKETDDDVVGPPTADVGDIQPGAEQPIRARHVCSPDLLASYQPNRTFYLDESTRCRLRELGQSPEGFQPAGTHAKEPYPRWLVDLTWNSSRLEGNTYSLLETWQFLHTGQPAEGKDAGATQMLLNHKAAIDLLVSIDLVNAPDGMPSTTLPSASYRRCSQRICYPIHQLPGGLGSRTARSTPCSTRPMRLQTRSSRPCSSWYMCPACNPLRT